MRIRYPCFSRAAPLHQLSGGAGARDRRRGRRDRQGRDRLHTRRQGGLHAAGDLRRVLPVPHGMYHICDKLKVMGFQTGGAAQEFFAVKREMVLKFPAFARLGRHDRAGLGGGACAVAGGQCGRLKVVVLGAGTIGNLVAQVAQASGARRDDHRRQRIQAG